MPVGTRVQFIDEPVKATTEPDGSRYIEVHNPQARRQAAARRRRDIQRAFLP
ncbi:hypothetical protein [Salmonella enterica]|uniref:hypothetical protein n=1 Tax=Salmonella enterica TaxID=28901 RepID=UPI003C6FE19D